jgi:hypothetical protein
MAVTQPFKVKCESCELIFVINDDSFIGKQISCRRCKYRFKIEQPQETAEVEAPAPPPAPKVNGKHQAANGKKPRPSAGFEPFTVKCALCELQITVSDPAFIGKKIKCRQCQYQFKIENPHGETAVEEAPRTPAPEKVEHAPPVPEKVETAPVHVEPVASAPAPVTTEVITDVEVQTAPAADTTTPPSPGDSTDTEEPRTVATVGKQKKKKKKSKSQSKITKVGVGIGLLAIGLVVGGYFAFFSKPSTSTQPTPQGIAKNQGDGDAGKSKAAVEPTKKKDPEPVIVPHNPPQRRDDRKLTNLLPGDTEWIVTISNPTQNAQDVPQDEKLKFLKTPVMGVLLDDAGPGKTFKKWMGFAAPDVDRVLVAGGLKTAWVFSVIHLSNDVTLTDLQNAMELSPKSTIRNRDYYRIKSNDLLKILSEFLAAEIKNQGLAVPLDTSDMALHLVDSQTLVVAHTPALQNFLAADMKWPEKTRYLAPGVPDPEPKKAALPEPKEVPPAKGPAKGPPPKGGNFNPKQPAPAPKAPPPPVEESPVDDIARGVSRIPHYLTVDPGLKTMLDRLELEKLPMVTFAVKLNSFERTYPGMYYAITSQFKELPAKLIPKTPVVGGRIQSFDNRSFSVSMGIQLENPEQTKFWLEPLTLALPNIANYLGDLIGVKINPKTPDAKALGAKEKDPFLNRFGVLDSFLWLTPQDRLIAMSLHVNWGGGPFDEFINHNLRWRMDLLRGRALMANGRAHWAGLSPMIEQMAQDKRVIPQGAYPRKTDEARFNLPYPPQDRVGWMVDLLPYLGYESIFRHIDKDVAWNNPKNLRGAQAWIPEFLNPSYPREARRAIVPSMRNIEFGATHFTGLAGIGLDAGYYPDNADYAKYLGIFGHERRTPFGDITAGDGASNTIFMIQTPPHPSRPWVRGGGATVQGVPLTSSVSPFVVDQPNGKKGAIALMADGSIRFISANISDEVFQALVTYKGGEPIDSIDKIAPRENPVDFEPRVVADSLVNFPLAGAAWTLVDIRDISGEIRMPSDPLRIITPEESLYTWPKNQEVAPILTLKIYAPETKIDSQSGTEAELDSMIEEMDKKGLKPQNQVKIKIAGNRPGRRFEISTSQGVFQRQLFISAGKAVLMEARKDGKASPENVTRYFDSLQMVGGGVKVESKTETKNAEPPKTEPKAPPKTEPKTVDTPPPPKGAVDTPPPPKLKETSPEPKVKETPKAKEPADTKNRELAPLPRVVEGGTKSN